MLPLAKDVSDLTFLLAYAATASGLVMFEIWAKIGEEVEEEDHHAVDADAVDDAEEALEEARDAAQDLARQISRAAPDVKVVD